MGAGIGNTIAGDPILLIAILAALAVFAGALYSIRRMAKDDSAARRRIAELEIKLNEAEVAIAAEAHVLVIWHGRDGVPGRTIGSMREAAQMPGDVAALLDFPAWLDRDSAEALSLTVTALRESGDAFNIGVRTLAGELLEADGRTAGGLAAEGGSAATAGCARSGGNTRLQRRPHVYGA